MSTDAVTLVKSHRFGSSAAKAVVFVIADYADSEWSSFVGQKRLAAEAEVGERTVRRILSDLEKRGLIRRDRRYREDGYRTSDRTLLIPEAIQILPVTVAAKRRILPATDDSLTGQSLAAQEPSGEPTSPNGDTTGLFEAFYEHWTGREYMTPVRLTKTERGRINKAVKEASALGVSAVEVRERGERYRKQWSEMEATPQALLANWSRFAPDKPLEDCVSCGNRGVVWYDSSGERVAWDAYDAEEAVHCPECHT